MLARNVGDDFPEVVLRAITGTDGTEVGELEVSCEVAGTLRHLLLSIVPTRIADGRGYFLLGADITEQKAMQERWRAQSAPCAARRRSSTSATPRSRSCLSSVSRTSGRWSNGSSPMWSS